MLKTKVDELSPNRIVAIDRGARLIGFGLSNTYKLTKTKVPTDNKRIDFLRLSASCDQRTIDKMLNDYTSKITSQDNLKILFLDDHISKGYTTNMIRKGLKSNRGVTPYFYFLSGGGDYSCFKYRQFNEWDDNPKLIGVDYEGLKPIVVRSKESKIIRKKIISSLSELI